MSRATGTREALAAAATALALLLGNPAAAQEHGEGWPPPVHDDQVFWFVLFDNLEYTTTGDGNPIGWEQEAWIGTDYHRLWLKTEGERLTRGPAGGDLEVQLLYGRLIAPFWELQAGVRYDRAYGPGPDRSRAHLAFGLQGLAPYWFEVVPTVFVSQDGDVSARIEASYDLLLSQRLVLQPELELNLAAGTVEDWGVGRGLSDVSVDLRLRYEVRRELAPYVGLGWSSKVGRTAELARADGSRVASFGLRAGLRLWF